MIPLGVNWTTLATMGQKVCHSLPISSDIVAHTYRLYQDAETLEKFYNLDTKTWDQLTLAVAKAARDDFSAFRGTIEAGPKVAGEVFKNRVSLLLQLAPVAPLCPFSF